MVVMRIFDWLFVDQSFRTNQRGETIFYPNGPGARGYQRRRPTASPACAPVFVGWRSPPWSASTLAVVVPDLLERWLGITLPLPWFIGEPWSWRRRCWRRHPFSVALRPASSPPDRDPLIQPVKFKPRQRGD